MKRTLLNAIHYLLISSPSLTNSAPTASDREAVRVILLALAEMDRNPQVSCASASSSVLHRALIGMVLALIACSTARADGLPEAPSASLVHSQMPAPRLKSFISDPLNRKLLLIDLGVRTIGDPLTTYTNLHNSCHCFHEQQLPSLIVKHPAAMVAYGAAVSFAVWQGAELMQRHGHSKIARLVVSADILGDGGAVLYNLQQLHTYGK